MLSDSPTTTKRPVGRPPLSPEVRKERQKVAKQVWKAANRAYVNEQIRVLSSRPEHLAHRCLRRRAKRQALIDAGIPVRNVGRPRKVPLARSDLSDENLYLCLDKH